MKAPRPKRPPGVVWLRVHSQFGVVSWWPTKREADAHPTYSSGEVTVGPYVLAERARQK